MFENELRKFDSNPLNNNPGTEHNNKAVSPDIDGKIAENEDIYGQMLTAGVMGNLQNEVVFILEGNDELAITPELRIENTAELPVINKYDVNPEIQNDNAASVSEHIVTNVANTVTPPETQAAGNTEAGKAESITAKPIIADNAQNATGDVMARTPDIRTQDSQDNKEQNLSKDNDSKSSEYGNLSPLENENDKTQVRGQQSKTYSEAVDAVKNAAENKEDTAIPISNETLPPLSEGIKPEQFRAVQQMTEATLSTPVKTENLFQEMISRVETMQNDAKSTMTIQLNPEYLGQVALEVAVDAAGLHVKINAEDSGVRNMINSQLTALIESLESKGIEVVEVEVAYTGNNFNASQDPRESAEQQSKRQRPTNREISPADGIALYTTLPDLHDYYQDVGVSSVEYSA
jgi:flagellar hook-length control protein FliK